MKHIIKIKKSIFFFIVAMAIANISNSQTIKQVRGTFVNLVYQDVRNKYMNPADVNGTDPQLWKTKMREYSDMGVSYVIIMALANEGKSYYPSKFMQHAYPEGRESPVEAIVQAADKYGMKVFLSCGWAYDQDDDVSKPETRAKMIKIMKELCDLFKQNKSFYGWYLPVEQSLAPILSDKAVEDVNSLTSIAKKLTPRRKVMISPYGIWDSEIGTKKFSDQIEKLKVDIIAYQDEIGCVRKPFPMERMKKNFKILGQIHKGTGIEFWSNIESFTWQKKSNSRESALIPAPFPRYLSQIVGATMAGAQDIVSFSVYGIMDNPDSDMPLGQPIWSAKFYNYYMDWLAGRGRWQLLEKTLKGSVPNIATGKTVHFYTKPSSKYNKGNLTDNSFGQENYHDSSWLGFQNGKMIFEVDLDSVKDVNSIALRLLHYSPANIFLPKIIDFYLSNDGISYWKAGTTLPDSFPNDHLDCWIDLGFIDKLKESARYIKVVASGNSDSWIFCDEIIVE